MARIRPAFLPTGAIDPAAIQEASGLLREGRLVALPTETVYGLAANAMDVAAVRRIFEAKGRPNFNPLITHVLEAKQAASLASHWSESAQVLADAFWPGPLSLVVPKIAAIPNEVTAGLPAVALRVPAHPVIRAVLQASGLALAAPSANRSNAISPTTAEHVAASLGDRVDLILDGGSCSFGIESTVVDLTTTPPRLLRPGGITTEQVERVVGALGQASTPAAGEARASPGQMERHYAPRATVWLVEPSMVSSTLSALPPDARPAGLMATTPRPHDARIVMWEVLGSAAVRYAQELYAALHRADAAGASDLIVERVPNEPAWDAVRDRLHRASTKE